jgi:hypothetical protein
MFCKQFDGFVPKDVQAGFQRLIDAAVDILKKHEGDEDGKKWVKVWHRTIFRNVEQQDIVWTKVVEVGR